MMNVHHRNMKYLWIERWSPFFYTAKRLSRAAVIFPRIIFSFKCSFFPSIFHFCFFFSCPYDSIDMKDYESNDKDWRDKWRVSITIRHCDVWRSRTSREVVIPTMGSDLRGRSDGASRRSHPRILSLSLFLSKIHFSELFIRGRRCHGDESRGTWSKFPGRSREITTDKVHDDRRIMRTMKV